MVLEKRESEKEDLCALACIAISVCFLQYF